MMIGRLDDYLREVALDNGARVHEEDRFTAYLMKNWKAGNAPSVKMCARTTPSRKCFGSNSSL